MASATRGVFSGGAQVPGSASNQQDFVTFASTGTCTAWGDTANLSGTSDGMGFSNSTRGIIKLGMLPLLVQLLQWIISPLHLQETLKILVI